MARIITVDIGVNAVPNLQPVPPVTGTWFPSAYVAPPLGVPVVTATPATDAVVLSWPAIATNPTYVIESAPDNAGAPGAYSEIGRTNSTVFAWPTTLNVQRWYRVRSTSNGRDSAWAIAVMAAPSATAGSVDQVITGLQQAIADIVSSNILSRSRKLAEVVRWNEAVSSLSSDSSKADAAGVSRTAYNAAYSALESYISSLVPSFTDTAVDTPVVGSTYLAKWNDYTTQRNLLLNAITDKARTTSTWSGVSGPGKPADGADVTANSQVYKDIVDDGIIDRSEKRMVNARWTEAQKDHAPLVSSAVAASLQSTGVYGNYMSAYDALRYYLTAQAPAVGGVVPLVGFMDTSVNTPVDAATYNARWSLYNEHYAQLDAAIKQSSANGLVSHNHDSIYIKKVGNDLVQQYVGSWGSQQILQTFGWNNGVSRWKTVLEPDGSFSLFSYDTNGGTPTNTMNWKSTVAGGGNVLTVPGLLISGTGNGDESLRPTNDASIWDVNIADTMGVRGLANWNAGWIKYGSGARFGCNSDPGYLIGEATLLSTGAQAGLATDTRNGARRWTFYDPDDSGLRVDMGGVGTIASWRSNGINHYADTHLPNNNLYFGAGVRQHINLWGTSYGIGVQNNSTYFRSGSSTAGQFSWHFGGVHSGGRSDPGAGGVMGMALSVDGVPTLEVYGEIRSKHTTYGGLSTFSRDDFNHQWTLYSPNASSFHLWKSGAGNLLSIGSDGAIAAAWNFNAPQGFMDNGHRTWSRNTRPELDSYAHAVSNWNDALSNGWYMAAGAANAPDASGEWFQGRVVQHNVNWVTQRVWKFTQNPQSIVWERRKLNGSWTAWTTEKVVGARTVQGPVDMSGNDINNVATIHTSNWFRSNGNSGWYSTTYGGGMYMTDAYWIRTYGGKGLLIESATTTGTNGDIRLKSFSPTIAFEDTDNGTTHWLHCNSNQIGFLQNNAYAWAAYRDSGNNWQVSGDNVAYASDRRLKKNIVDVPTSRVDEFFDKVRIREYDWDADVIAAHKLSIEAKKNQVGAIAQEIQEIFPDAVAINEAHNPMEGEKPNFLTIKWDKLVPLLIDKVQRQDEEIKELKKMVKELIS